MTNKTKKKVDVSVIAKPNTARVVETPDILVHMGKENYRLITCTDMQDYVRKSEMLTKLGLQHATCRCGAWR